ncbi:leucine-rich repeat protein, partial [Skeletonema marinoi]
MTDEEWEELGRDMSNNTHLEDVHLDDGALNDHKISFLFRGLTKSNSIEDINFCSNALSVQGVRSMVPFLQNAANFSSMYLVYNNLLSEGFNELFRALRNNPIEILNCSYCGICSIQIDIASFPRNLTYLMLNGNKISTDGCRVLAKLLQEEDSTLAHLQLRKNKIGDEGVAILVDALQNNKSLGTLDLRGNDGISKQ